MARLLIVVPERRDRCGKGVVLRADGSTALGPFLVLATTSRRVAARHGNPERDPGLPFGNPAAGGYVVAGALPPRAPHRRKKRFGSLGAFLLRAASGPALAAAARGRGLIALHGGPVDRKGRLRPTRGGLRVQDGDLAALFTTVNELHGAGDPLEGIEILDAPEVAGEVPASERPGGRRYRGWKPKRVAGGVPAAAAAGALAAWLGGARSESVNRRAFLAGALALIGGLGLEACRPPSACAPGQDGISESPPAAADGGPPLVVISGPNCDSATYRLQGDRLVLVGLVPLEYVSGGGGGGGGGAG